MTILDIVGKPKSHDGFGGAFTRIVLRFLQFVLACTVAGLYGIDLHNAAKAGAYMDAKWVFAEVTAGLSAITCLTYGLARFLPSEKMFAWDWIIFILWTTLFGIFGMIYIPDNPTPEQHGQIRMKHAVWVDLTCMIFWFITAVYATTTFFYLRKKAGKGDSKA